MSRKQEEQKKRKMLLELEYPDLVSKLALLLGAGMTLQGAFRKNRRSLWTETDTE